MDLLPNEVLSKIIRYLKCRDQLNLISSNRTLRKLIAETDIWLRIDKMNYRSLMMVCNHNLIYLVPNISVTYFECHMICQPNFHFNRPNTTDHDLHVLNYMKNNNCSINLMLFDKIRKIKLAIEDKCNVSGLALNNPSWLHAVVIKGDHSYDVNQLKINHPDIKFEFKDNSRLWDIEHWSYPYSFTN
jgi:hypothetical protein